MNINPFDILKNAQKLQEQMGVFQEKLGNIVVTGSAGAGMVEIDINGRMEILDARIAREVIDPENKQMIQDLVLAAFNDATAKVRAEINRELGAMTGIPGGFSGFPGFTGV